PLPEVTLFPNTFLPLHVFEARYRAMVADALARDRRLAVARLEPGYESTYDGRPPVRAVAGAGEIVNWERQSSGRYNILLRGVWRGGLGRAPPADRPPGSAPATRLDDVPAGGAVDPLIERIRAACGRLLDALERPRTVLEGVLGKDQPPAMIADRAAAAFLP